MEFYWHNSDDRIWAAEKDYMVANSLLSLHEVSLCLTRYDLRAKVFPHKSQLCGREALCVWRWALRLDLSEKLFWQMGQL